MEITNCKSCGSHRYIRIDPFKTDTQNGWMASLVCCGCEKRYGAFGVSTIDAMDSMFKVVERNEA